MSTASSQFVLLLGHGEDSRAVAQAVFATLVYSFVLVANIYFWLAPFFARNKRPQHAPTTPDLQSPRSESPDAKPVPDLEVADITATKSSLGRYSSSSTGEDAPSENSNKQRCFERATASSQEEATTVHERGARPRLHYFDNLKAFCILAVVIHHVVCIFSPSGYFFYAFISPLYDPGLGWSAAAAYFISVQQAYLMALFYFLSAYLVPDSFERKGAARFLRDRVRRLGLPLLVLAFGLNPLLNWFVWLGPVHNRGFEFFVPWAYRVDPNHMWFIIWLLVFNVAYLIIALATSRRAPAKIDLPSLPWILTVGLTLGFVKGILFGFFDVDWIFAMLIAYFPDYVLMFTVGVIAKRNDWLTQLHAWDPSSKRACVAITAVLAMTLLPVRLASSYAPGQGWLSDWLVAFLYGANSATFMVSMCTTMLLVFHRFVNFANRTTKFCSDAAYTVYLIHGWTLVTVAWSYAEMLTAAGQLLVYNMVLNSVSLTTYWLVFLGAIYTAVCGAPLTWALAWCLAKAPILRRIL